MVACGQCWGSLGVVVLCLAISGSSTAATSKFDGSSDEETVRRYVAMRANETFREPSGLLKHPYLVPSGPYDQLWDWDSVFTGVALLPFGSARFLEGSMLNFLDAVDSAGRVPGCLTPSGPSTTVHHAKPIIIQGAWLVARHTGNYSAFRPHRGAMKRLLAYWRGGRRVDSATGLSVWYDGLESGADNLPTFSCPSSHSPSCWSEPLDALAVADTAVMGLLARELRAFARFEEVWEGHSRSHKADPAAAVEAAVEKWLWHNQSQSWLAWNVTRGGTEVDNHVYTRCLPLWWSSRGPARAKACATYMRSARLLSPFGYRSTSPLDPRYSNALEIDPYSNWRGPVWVNANALLCYGLSRGGQRDEALTVAARLLRVLARDVEANGAAGKAMHECYDSDSGEPLAAPGFLSWNTLAADLMDNLRKGVDPLAL